MGTNYEAVLQPGAERVLRPLADKAAVCEKELAGIRKRLADETERAKGAADSLAVLKGEAGQHLAGDGNAYERFKTTLKKRMAILEASKETVRILADEIIPQAERGLMQAKKRLQVAFLTFAATARPTCEAKMADLVGAVLAERDAFMRAFDLLAAKYGADFSGNARFYPDPLHIRPDPLHAGRVIATSLEESFTDAESIRRQRGGPWLMSAPPAAETLPAAPQAPQVPQAERGPADEAQESSPDLGAPETPVNLAPASAADDVAGAAPEPSRDVAGLADAEAEAPPVAEAVPAEEEKSAESS